MFLITFNETHNSLTTNKYPQWYNIKENLLFNYDFISRTCYYIEDIEFRLGELLMP